MRLIHGLDELEAQGQMTWIEATSRRNLQPASGVWQGVNQEALMNTSEHRDDDSQRLGAVSRAPTQFIQICASQNDLFALDKEGHIYQYNFSAKAWAKLAASRSYEEHA